MIETHGLPTTEKLMISNLTVSNVLVTRSIIFNKITTILENCTLIDNRGTMIELDSALMTILASNFKRNEGDKHAIIQI